MAETTLHIAGRQYDIRCRDGEEPHLAHLASVIETKVRATQRSAPGLTEVRTLLFAALHLADEAAETRRELASMKAAIAEQADDEPAAKAIILLAERIEKLSASLAVSDVNA